MGQAMPLPQYVAISFVVFARLILNFLNYYGMLNTTIWQLWKDFITIGGLSVLPHEQGVDQADLIAFLLELSFHTAGEAYNLDTLTDDQTTMIKDLAYLGLVKLQKGRKESWFIPTKLATNLSVSLTDSSSRKHRLNHGQKTDKSSSYARLAELSSSRRLNLSRSWSCRADVMGDTSSPYADEEYFEITPSNGLEKIFPGRPQGLKKQLANGQVQSTGLEADESGKGMRDVGLDPMYDGSSTHLHWSHEFERLQRAILELWQACNISLVHRTYFFLLCKGDSADSIYMEVELRRLTFLKKTFSQRNQAIEDGRTLTLASSLQWGSKGEHLRFGRGTCNGCIPHHVNHYATDYF